MGHYLAEVIPLAELRLLPGEGHLASSRSFSREEWYVSEKPSSSHQGAAFVMSESDGGIDM